MAPHLSAGLHSVDYQEDDCIPPEMLKQALQRMSNTAVGVADMTWASIDKDNVKIADRRVL